MESEELEINEENEVIENNDEEEIDLEKTHQIDIVYDPAVLHNTIKSTIKEKKEQ